MSYTKHDLEELKKSAKILNIYNLELGYGLSLKEGEICESELEIIEEVDVVEQVI